jgi:hypothetical protein
MGGFYVGECPRISPFLKHSFFLFFFNCYEEQLKQWWATILFFQSTWYRTLYSGVRVLCILDHVCRLSCVSILYFVYTDFFATRLIINKINKVQWVDFMLENVLVSLHSLKTMGRGTFGVSAPLFLRNGELLGWPFGLKRAYLCN